MTFTDLIYKLTEFFFNDLIHFIQLIIIGLFLRGVVRKMADSAKNFFAQVFGRAKRKSTEEDVVRNIREHMPKELKKILGIKEKESENA